MAEGYIINIPNKVLEKLQMADKKILEIAKHSENTQRRVQAAFSNMANSVDPFINKLSTLKQIGKIKLDTTLKSSASSAEQAASSIAQVATQLNRVADSPIDVINRKLESMRLLLSEANAASTKLANDTSKGIISKDSLNNGTSANQLIPEIQGQIKVLELQRTELQNNDKYWKQYLDTLNGASIAEQKQAAEMKRLNDSFKGGSSLLQRQAKAEDDLAKAVANAANSINKAAEAEGKRKNAQTNKDNRAAIKAEQDLVRALKMSENSFGQRHSKVKALAAAQEALTATGRNYKSELAKIAAETERLNNFTNNQIKGYDKLKQSQSKILDTTSQLKRQLALLFSVSAIEGYIMQMVNVRGEFELQQRALQSIIQNKEKANEIWDKTVQLAVRSPFSVKELVTYTKQLAAYRIEADKLYSTNKMLADVSAGLGVSMDRLILAFGQVKAANFLRASEVRQFTEAGVNILGELAKYYTELEGTMVSVGDVQERITKRMVTFGDVEEIFKRITSAGGIFYNMQEVQAETLSGMISNLKDSLDLMFNSIGKSNEGVLKGFVSLLRSITENWKTIANIALPLLAGMAARWISIKLAAISLPAIFTKISAQIVIMSKLLKGTENQMSKVEARALRMKGATKGSGWATALGIVAIVLFTIYELYQNIGRKQRELNQIALDGQMDMSKSVANYEKLANTVADSTKSYEEQKNALDELKRTYGDILPQQYLELEYIKSISGNYDKATDAIRRYMASKVKQKQIDLIIEDNADNIKEKTDSLAEFLQAYIKGIVGYEPAMSDVLYIVDKLREGLENGSINADNLRKSLTDITKKQFNIDITPKTSLFGNAERELSERLRNFGKEIKKQMDEINNLTSPILSKPEQDIERRINNIIDIYNKEIQNVKNALNTLSSYKTPTGTNPLITETQINEAKSILLNFFGFAGQEAEKFKKKMEAALTGDKQAVIDISDMFNTLSVEKQSKALYKQLGEDADIYVKKLKESLNSYTDFQKEVHDELYSFADSTGISLAGLDYVFAKSSESTIEYGKRLKKAYDKIIEEIKLMQLPTPLAYDKDKLDKLQDGAKVLEHMLSKSYIEKGSDKKSEREADKRLKERIDLIKKAGKAYEENLKYYNKEEAYLKTKSDYLNAFKEAKIPNILERMDFKPQGVVAELEDLGRVAGNSISNSARIALEKAISDLRGEINLEVRVNDIERKRKELEKLFDNYQMSVEVESYGLDKDFVASLYNIDLTSLDDIKDKLSSMFPDVSKLSKKELELYKETEGKITANQQKELKKRLDQFREYLDKSVSEIKRVQNDGALDISIASDLFQRGKLDAKQYGQIIDNVVKSVNEKVGKIKVEEFKKSPEYIRAMGDFSMYSEQELKKLLNTFQDFINLSSGDIAPTELKSFLEQIQKMQNELSKKKSPIGEFISKNAFAQFKELRRLQKEYNTEEDKLNGILEKRNSLKEKEIDIQRKLQAKQDELPSISPESAGNKDEIAALQEEYNLVKENGAELDNQAKNVSGKMGQISSKIKNVSDGMGSALGMVDKIVTGIYQSINATLDLMNQFKDLAESNGVDTTKGGWREVAQAGELLGNVNNKVMSSWNNFKSGNIAGAVADAVGSITTIFTTLNKQHDARREQDIQEEIKLVGRLQKEYERLEKAIDNAYSIDTLNAANKNAEENIKKQIQSYQNMIESEKDKKDTDWDRIEEWNQAIQDSYAQLEQIRASKLQELGGFGSGEAIKSAAEDFASSWLESFRETGNGLSSLEDKWDEYFDNIVTKQIALRAAEKYIKPITDAIDSAMEHDSYMSTEEMERIRQMAKNNSADFDRYMQTVAETLGIIGGIGSGELDGLSKSIQGVTENTAEIIASYLDSVRFYVADSNLKITQLAALASADPKVNPILFELQSQTGFLMEIRDMFNSVLKAGHTKGGFGVKCFI